MLKYSDFLIQRSLLREGGPGSGPQPKDGGGSQNTTNTEKQKSEGEKKETTQTTEIPKPKFFDDKVKREITGGQYDVKIESGEF